MLPAKASVIMTEKPIPSVPPLPGPPTMSPTPSRAITMASPALAVIGSRSAIQARSAAAIGETACRKRTFATVEWLRATMNDPDAIAVVTATPSPAMPMELNEATVRRRFADGDEDEQREEGEERAPRELRRRVDRELALQASCGRPGDRCGGDVQLPAAPGATCGVPGN